MWIRVPRHSSTQSLTVFHLVFNYRIQRVTQNIYGYWSLACTYMHSYYGLDSNLSQMLLKVYGQNSIINPWDQQSGNYDNQISTSSVQLFTD